MMETTLQDKLLKKGWFRTTEVSVTADHGGQKKSKSGKPNNKSTRGKSNDHNANLLDQKVKRTKSASKSGDETSKKRKPHQSAVNNLLQTGWMVMNKTRHQITVVKIPGNNSTNCDIKCGKLKDKQTTDIKQGDGNVDVEANIADMATRKRSVLNRFIRRSRQILRRLMCGRTTVE